jgi:hypothetical protein
MLFYLDFVKKMALSFFWRVIENYTLMQVALSSFLRENLTLHDEEGT